MDEDDDDDTLATPERRKIERIMTWSTLSFAFVVCASASFRSQLLHPRVQYVPEPSDVALVPMDVLTLTDGIVVAWGDLNNDYQCVFHKHIKMQHLIYLYM
jgi:hypothetical protein